MGSSTAGFGIEHFTMRRPATEVTVTRIVRVQFGAASLLFLFALTGCGGGDEASPTVSSAPAASTGQMLHVTLSGGGTVQSSPAGIACTGACSSSFASGQTVTLTAIAANGFVFGGWSGACSGSALSCVVTMTAAHSVVATFTSATSVCSNFYPSGFGLVSGQGTYPIATVGRLTKGVAFRDPVFGTCVVRATNHAVEPPSGFARNDYSRRQAFNADSSRFIVYAYDGYWHLYNAVTLAHVMVLPGLAGDAEPQWHPTDPNRLRYFPTNGAGGKLYELDTRTGQSVLLADFAAKVPAGTPTNFIWSKSEGSPSADHR